jgi:C1A family cysteine protease
MELLCRKFPKELPKETLAKFPDPTKVVLSPLFAYWWNRRNDGKIEVQEGLSPAGTELKYIDEDRGANMRSGMRTLRWQGVCLETEDIYNPRNFRQKPNLAACDEAMLFRGGAYHRLTTLEDMKNCLRTGYPFTMAIEVYDSFESSTVAHTGVVPVPNPASETLQGGHAVLCVGFDEKAGTFLVRNSWGDDWGNAGYFTLPFAFFPFISDMWMMHFGPAWK